jgi:hypothetical protein
VPEVLHRHRRVTVQKVIFWAENLEVTNIVRIFAPRWELHIGAMTSSSATV